MMLNAEHNSNLAPFILFSKTEFFLLVGIHLPSLPCGLEGFFCPAERRVQYAQWRDAWIHSDKGCRLMSSG